MLFTTIIEKDNPSLLVQLREVNKYQPWINEASEKYSLQPCVIAGLGSRESQWGLALKPRGPDGCGDFTGRKPKLPWRPETLPPDGLGFGRGLLQIDYDWHEFARVGDWMNPRENILYGCKVLDDFRQIINSKLIHDEKEVLRMVLAAYNCGSARMFSAIREGIDVDSNTSGGNYSADVLNRAGWFQLQGWT